jgi:hypothetical protein
MTLAIIGFAVVVILSVLLVGVGLFLLWAGTYFGQGAGDIFVALTLIFIGGGGLYYAWGNAPFHLVMGAS